MTTEKRGPLDGLPPELQAAIRAETRKAIEAAPPLTEFQKQLIKRLFSPRVKETKP